VLESDLVQARGMVVELDQPGIGPVKQVGSPLKLSRTPPDTTGAAPALGADTDAVLAAAGYDDETIAGLREDGVL